MAVEQPVIMAHGQANAEIRTDGGAPALTCLHEAPIVAHTLKGEGFDASEDGTGRGMPLVPVAYRTTGNDGAYETGSIVHALTTATDPNSHVLAFQSNQSFDSGNNIDISPTLRVGSNGQGQPPAIAFSSKDDGADATADLSPTLRALGAYDANGGGQMAVAYPLQEVGKRTGTSTTDPRAGIGIGQDGDAMYTLQAGAQHGGAAFAFAQNTRDEVRLQGGDGQIVGTLAAEPGMKQTTYVAVDAAPCVATFQQSSMKGKGTIGYDDSGIAKPVKTQMDGQMLHQHMAVRRLTPVECERLQGFPDNYTLIPWRKKPAADCPDGPRYKALGNSMAVPCMRWIGARINQQLATDAGNA